MRAGRRVAAPFLLGILGLAATATTAAFAVAEQTSPLDERIAAAEAVVAAEAQRLLDAGAASVSVGLLVGHEVVSATAFGHANVFFANADFWPR